MGGRRLSGPDGSDPTSRSEGSGHDLPQDEVQALCGRVTKEKEYDEVESQSESRICVPHPEARVRLRHGEIPGIAKNHHRLCANFALVNLYLHRRRLAVIG
jgi:hypothetical protein